jgi:hypothetical protein
MAQPQCDNITDIWIEHSLWDIMSMRFACMPKVGILVAKGSHAANAVNEPSLERKRKRPQGFGRTTDRPVGIADCAILTADMRAYWQRRLGRPNEMIV